MTIALQASAGDGAEGEDVAGRHDVGTRGTLGDGSLNGASAVEGGNPRGHAGPSLDRDREAGLAGRPVRRDHLLQAQPVHMFRGQGQADQPPSEAAHEVHDLGGGELGGADEVTFVLPVLVIHQDDQAPSGKPI